MAENKEGQEKTEDATGRRLQESRDRGQVSKSVDVTTAGILLLGGMTLFIFGPEMMASYKGFMVTMLHESGSMQLTEQNTIGYFYHLIAYLAKLMLPMLGIIFVIALVGEIAQVGFYFAPKKFTEGLNFKRVFNPFSGMKNMFFSSRSYFELIKSFLKLTLLGAIAYNVLASKTEELIGIIERPFFDIAQMMVAMALELVVKIGILYMAIAVGDYLYQKWKFKQDMMMTKQEVKEESKQSEGDPHVKSRIRNLMRGRLRKIMLSKVPEADVVITNPTHYAVALKYKPGQDGAPVLLAKGVDHLAFKIRDLAKSRDIPIVEEPPLARALYFSVEVDTEIPEHMFKAVAQVLAYVYKVKDMKKKVG